MTWDPFGTIGNALWISGAQWAGKSTVARILAGRLGLTAYHADFANLRGHHDRSLVAAYRAGETPQEFDPEQHWVRGTPEDAAAELLAGFRTTFDWLLDDLRALVSGRPVLVEGWALRPELVAPLLEDPRRMVVMVPTEAFRQHQLQVVPRARSLASELSDPELGQRNRLARDRLVADDVVAQAREHGIEVIEVDGSLDEQGVADLLEARFAPFLDLV